MPELTGDAVNCIQGGGDLGSAYFLRNPNYISALCPPSFFCLTSTFDDRPRLYTSLKSDTAPHRRPPYSCQHTNLPADDSQFESSFLWLHCAEDANKPISSGVMDTDVERRDLTKRLPVEILVMIMWEFIYMEDIKELSNPNNTCKATLIASVCVDILASLRLYASNTVRDTVVNDGE